MVNIVQCLKNILVRLNLIDDYVVEEGTSDIWTYRKWASGKAEAWSTVSFSCGVITWGSLYEANTSVTLAYPTDVFNTKPKHYHTYQPTNGNGAWSYVYAATSTTLGKLSVTRPTAATLQGNVNNYLVGTWR